jgi:hypothetical protein
MSIQANINQQLSLAGVLLTQNPAAKAAAERRQERTSLKRQEQAINRAIEATGSDIAAKEPYGEDLAAVKKRQFELDPSDKTWAEYKGTQTRKVAESPADEEEIIQERYEAAASEQAVNDRVSAMLEADRSATDAVSAERARILRSRDFARMITEGVPNLSFNPDEYVPPERKER